MYVTIMALLRLGGTDPGGSLRLTSCLYEVQYNRVLRALYRQGVNISRDGVPTASLGNLLQYLITFILIFPSIRLKFPVLQVVTAVSPSANLYL